MLRLPNRKLIPMQTNVHSTSKPLLGLRENWNQFWLLVFINALVGGMIGLERTVLPQIAREEFSIQSNTVILLFIITFGLAKSITNYLTGLLAEKFGRKRMLVAGWIFALPVPFILMHAGSWSWIIFANVLLGVSQGITWSSTVVMKIDLVGHKQRGFAMGLNEFAGYVSIAITAFATSYIADRYGIRPYPFYLGVVLSVLGLLLSFLLVKDTTLHARTEGDISTLSLLNNVTFQTTWKHRNLGSVTQAGFVNNLNDAMVWGLLPLLLTDRGFSLIQVGLITGLYPAVWGVSQLYTGKLSDQVCKKKLLFWGMLLQGIAILLLAVADGFNSFVLIAVLLGLGTAVVYPTFLASIAENVHASQRAQALGTFRFWRDFGYVAGAGITGVLLDLSGTTAAIVAVGMITIASSLIILKRMYCFEDAVSVA
jgi:MFS family permease